MRKLFWLLPLLALAAGCDATKPKVLGYDKLYLGVNTSTPDAFKFNFAFRDPGAATTALQRVVYLQGAADTKTPIISTCNGAGTNCVCEFQTSSGAVIESTATTAISYNSAGNYLRCNYAGDLTTLAKVRVHNQNNTVTSVVYDVDTALTAAKILGSDLNMNQLRTVYRYTCLNNFLQKDGTSSTSFDCTSQASQCWNNGGTSGDFCLLQASYPYFLYSDNLSNNIGQKVADKLYNQGADDRICGVQIKQYDCAGTGGTPTPIFGIYGEQKGVFDTSVSMGAGPDIATTTYGYAAKPSTLSDGSIACPPGLQRQIFYRTTTDATSTGVSSNLTSTEVSEVSAPGAAPTALSLTRIRGGDCSGTACTLPTTSDGQIKTFTYVSDASTLEFCVIPPGLLP